MGIEIISEFINGSTVRTIVHVYNDSDALVDPTSVAVNITDPAGTVVVDGEDITAGKTAAGTYPHYYNTSAGSVKGWYQGKAVIVDGAGDGAKTSIGTFSFKVK